jgi:hypothetical protein
MQPISPAAATSMYQYGGTGDVSLAPGSAYTGTNPYAAGVSGTGALLPNQIDPKNYANMYEYQKQLGWAAFEEAGYDPGLAQEAFEKSLPKYGGPTAGSFAM